MKIGINAILMQSTPGYGKAGIGRYHLSVIDGLQRLDQVNEYFVFIDPDFVVPAEWQSAKNFRFIHTHKVLGRRKLVWPKLVAPLEIARHRLDIWFCLETILPNFCTAKCATLVYDLSPIKHPELFTERHVRIFKGTMFTTIRRADVIFCISRYTLEEVATYTDPAKLVVAYLGPGNVVERTDPAKVNAERLAQLGVRAPRYYFALSTVEPRKNLEGLVQAFAKIADEPEFADTNLVVAGAKGWKTSRLFEIIENLNIGHRIDFLGYVPDEDLSALFAGARAFVVASITEGFGIPVLEAMLAGAPVVSSNGGSLPEVGGDVPIYFDPLDIDDIVRALRAQAKDPRPRSDIVSAGLLQASKFSWEAHCRVVLDSFDKLAPAR